MNIERSADFDRAYNEQSNLLDGLYEFHPEHFKVISPEEFRILQKYYLTGIVAIPSNVFSYRKTLIKDDPRASLFVLAFVLCFTSMQPAQVAAWGLFGDGTPKASVLAAEKVDTTADQATMESAPTPVDEAPVQDSTPAYEDAGKRTAYSSTFVNKDGTKPLTQSLSQQNFKDGGSWKKIDNRLQAVEKPVAQKNAQQQIASLGLAVDPPTAFRGKAGNVATQIRPLAEGLQITAEGKTITIKPQGARNATPEQKDDRTVIYRNVWPQVDLEYELRGETVKEIIVVKSKAAQATYNFTVEGGTVVDHPTRKGELTIAGMPEEFSFSALTLDVNEIGVISEPRVTQTATPTGIKVVMDQKWVQSQPAKAFPMRIDPTFGKQSEISYRIYKSDGYSCNASNCYANIGTIDDGSGWWRNWRTYVNFPYNELNGKKVINANLHGYFKYGANGITDNRTIYMGHATCLAFGCPGNLVGSTTAGTDFDINFTGELTNAVNAGNYGAWWSLAGEEGGYKSFKPYADMRADIQYDTPTPQAAPTEPADKQVTVNTQPTLRVNPVSDPDGDPVEYYFRVSTGSDAETGAVINSGWIKSTQWVIPDGILQDGTTYYWHAYTKGATQTNPNWVRSFKLDLRTGKDSTQAYDTVGPMGVDLATGNGTTSTSTHSMSALGGSIGLSMDYNSPVKSKTGLIGEYWNIPQNYAFASGAPTGTPAMVRNDQDINFDFGSGTPGGTVGTNWFYARWKGYFVAPTTGSYEFGAVNDDYVKITVDGQFMGSGCYGSAPCYGGNSITLQAGQVVPINVEYQENTAEAKVKLYVRGAVSEQIVSREWLQTEVVAGPSQYGLTGRYYTDDGSHNFPTNTGDPMRLMMARQDNKLAFNWGAGGPAPGQRADNFMVRWTGYITVPATGSYTFGAASDDGVRIKLNNGLFGASQTVLDSWKDQAGTFWGSATNLTAGQQVPITVEYYERTGNANITLQVKQPGSSTEEEVLVKWLTPKASALPDAWQLGVDVDGSVSYERLRVAGSNIILEDATRATHEYTWTGSGYKPPVNEEGQLTRNADNTYTFYDTDGRTYLFNAEGKLTSLTTPTDERNPASLKYEYSGDPARLMKISDGVTADRYGTLHYKSVNEDGNCSVPGGFDAAPDGMLCAFKTSDGDITKLYYKAGQLSRIEKSGSDTIDYGYDTLGRIISTRDSMANDAIAAAVRTDNDELLTQITYDQLGRISSVKAPAPSASAVRNNHTFEYLPTATQLHIAGATEPHGFSKRVEYDTLFRTTKETDVANLSTTQEWDSVKDLQLASTDATGLKTTTIYNDDDRPVENYGAAPAEWYGTDRKPLAAYAGQIPKTTTGYDEGMTGLAVAYMASNAPAPTNKLANGKTLARGATLSSLDGRFRFIHQTDGNVVLYSPSGAVWASNTGGRATTGLVMQGDGNLVLYNGGSAVWATGTTGGSTSYLAIQNDGNVVIYNATQSTWATNTGGWSAAGAAAISLTGAPLLHATNIATNGTISKAFGSTPPITGHTGSWGMRMTGKMRLPTAGNWKFRIASDNGVRMWIDDALVLDDWTSGDLRSHATVTYNNTVANSLHRVRIDYYHTANDATFSLYATPPGGTETTNVAQYFNPNYSLKTSQTAYDAQLGDVTTQTTYTKPEYGLLDKATLDPTGLNLQTTSTYETPGSGYLRQTGRTLPGGTSNSYSHYGANDSVDNPCTAENDPAPQAGAIKGKTETDPDGPGPKQPRTTETVYNASGRVAATKFNNDPWTCTTYDARGRQTQSVQPTVNGRPGRTVATQYAADGNPLKTRTTDSVAGTTETTVDILGRTVSTKDVWGNEYVSIYDDYGNVTQKTGQIGTETYTYDTFLRLTSYALDSTTLATVAYDNFGRLATVTYPQAKDATNNSLQLTQVKRDSIGRSAGMTYQTSDGKTFDENVVKSQLGKVINATQSYDAQTIHSSFTYDLAGRLTSGTVGQTKFDYGYNAPDSTACGANPANNAQSHKNSNRTSYKVTNIVTSTVVTDDKLCYNYADQLTYSTDANIGTPTYDDHGNTTAFTGNGTPLQFGYNASDYNISITQGTKRTEYLKNATGDILRKKEFEADQLTSSYRYAAGGRQCL